MGSGGRGWMMRQRNRTMHVVQRVSILMVEGLEGRSVLMSRFNNVVRGLRSDGRDKKRNVQRRRAVNPASRLGRLRMSVSSGLVKGMSLRRRMVRGSVMSVLLLEGEVVVGRMEVMHLLVHVREGVQKRSGTLRMKGLMVLQLLLDLVMLKLRLHLGLQLRLYMGV